MRSFRDGTFSPTQDGKKGLKKLFDLDVRSSGTWKLEGDTIVVRVTQSNDDFRNGQISYKVTTIAKDELITVNQYGNARHRKAVFLPTQTAVRFHPVLAAFYARLVAAGKAKMQAIGACMRKLAMICYGVLKNRAPFDAEWA